VRTSRETLRATPLHADVIAALHALSFPAPWKSGEFDALLRQPGVAAWISVQNDTPVGFVMVRAVADEAEILTIAVAPSHRRRGIGTQLIDHTRASLIGSSVVRLFLEVAADNAAALTLYQACGFAPCGRRANYYTSGGGKAVDALLMSLQLIPNDADLRT